MEVQRIFYGENENQFAELRIPEGKGPHPVAILIHGGQWKASLGNIQGLDPIALRLTSRGFATWNVEYRRVGHPGGGWPGTFTDVADAADFLYTLDKSYSLDLNRVITVGHSAGGHLALWLAGRHRLPDSSVIKTNDHPLPIFGTVSLAGASDLALMQELSRIGGKASPEAELLEGTYDQVSERYAEASPIQLLPLGVKQLLVHGHLDSHVPLVVSLNYKLTAERAGDQVKMIELPTYEHFKLINTHIDSWTMIEEGIINMLNDETQRGRPG